MPIPFPTPTTNVPILGQQIAVEGYTIAITARCQCHTGGSPVLLTLTTSVAGLVSPPNACVRCGSGYAVQGMQLDQQGRLMFAIAVLGTAPPLSS